MVTYGNTANADVTMLPFSHTLEIPTEVELAVPGH